MLRAIGVCSDERQVNGSGGGAGQFDLCLFSSFLQTLGSNTVLSEIDAVVALEIVSDPVDDSLVEVIAAQTGVAVGGQHFKYAVADIQDGYIEGAAAQVVHQDLLGAFLVKAVSQGSSCRLVDDTLDVQTGNAACVLGGLTLAVVEVGRHGDDSFCDLFSEIGFSRFLHLAEDHSADVLGSIVFSIDAHFVCRAHFTLDGNHRTVRVGHGLTLCHLADQTLTVFCKSHDRRRCTAAFSVCNHHRLSAFHNGNAAVGCTKVNTNNLRHNVFLLVTLSVLYVIVHCMRSSFG